MLAQRLSHDSGYSRGFDPRKSTDKDFSQNSGLQIVPPDPTLFGSAYVIVDDFFSSKDAGEFTRPGPAFLAEPPLTWWEVATIGDREGYQMHVFRTLSAVDAASELAAARKEAKEHPGPESARRLMGAEVNGGQTCAYIIRGRRDSVGTRPHAGDGVLLRLLTACYSARPGMAGPNLIHNGDFASGLDGWNAPHADDVEVAVEPHTADAPRDVAIHATSTGQRAVLLQGLLMKPDTPYVYEADIKSTAPVVALYWESDTGRFKVEDYFPKWTTVTYLFITPHWDGQLRHVDIHPILAKGRGDAWLRNVRLSELQPDRDTTDHQKTP